VIFSKSVDEHFAELADYPARQRRWGALIDAWVYCVLEKLDHADADGEGLFLVEIQRREDKLFTLCEEAWNCLSNG
jgi:hypothetical protein